jgi:hypothetical protein
MTRVPSILASPRTRRRTALLGAFVGAAPFVWGLAAIVVAPSFSSPMFSESPTLIGIPSEVIIVAVALAWGAIGGLVVGTSGSRWVLPLALALFTLPACLALILGPALVLILQNLGS